MSSILSELIRADRLLVIDSIDVESPKTKLLKQQLSPISAKSILIVADQVNENLYLAARNLMNVDVRDVSGVDPVSLVGYDKVVITVLALKIFEEVLA